jgi:integrase
MMTTEEGTTTTKRDRPERKGGKLPPGVYWRHQKLWISYYITDAEGRRVKHREPTEAKSPREAAQLRATRMTEHARGERTVDTGKVTVGDALDAVLAEYERQGRASLDSAKGRAKAIEAALGRETLAVSVTDRVDTVQLAWRRGGLKAGGVNRRCNLLRRGLRILVYRRRLPFVPYIPTLEEHSARARRISAGERDAIAAQLPLYVRAVFLLALLLGIRRGQLSRTLRRYVDRDRGVLVYPPGECKARTAHKVPLDPAPLAIIEDALSKAVPWCPYLFHGPDCRPGHQPSKRYGCVGDFKKAFRAAVLSSGLPYGRAAGGIVFHCTRATAATDLRAAGLTETEVMRTGGWKTREVFDRYDLGDVEALRARLAAARTPTHNVIPIRRREESGA